MKYIATIILMMSLFTSLGVAGLKKEKEISKAEILLSNRDKEFQIEKLLEAKADQTLEFWIGESYIGVVKEVKRSEGIFSILGYFREQPNSIFAFSIEKKKDNDTFHVKGLVVIPSKNRHYTLEMNESKKMYFKEHITGQP